MSKEPNKRSEGRRNRTGEEERTRFFSGRKFVVPSAVAAIFLGVVFYQFFGAGFSVGNLLNAGIGNGKKPLVAMDFSVDTVDGKYVYSENKGKTLVYFFSFPG